jgi:hypothetical protein
VRPPLLQISNTSAEHEQRLDRLRREQWRERDL